jgi:hypothetical protein
MRRTALATELMRPLREEHPDLSEAALRALAVKRAEEKLLFERFSGER